MFELFVILFQTNGSLDVVLTEYWCQDGFLYIEYSLFMNFMETNIETQIYMYLAGDDMPVVFGFDIRHGILHCLCLRGFVTLLGKIL